MRGLYRHLSLSRCDLARRLAAVAASQTQAVLTIAGPRHDGSAIEREGDGIYRVGMTPNHTPLDPRRRIVDTNRLIDRARSDEPAVGREGDGFKTPVTMYKRLSDAGEQGFATKEP